MSDPIRECRSIIEHHSKSFAMASRLLPRSCRDNAVVVYAWCRRADDAVDNAGSSDTAAALATLREELVSIYAGTPQSDPILAAFQHVTCERKIPVEYPSELLCGMEMDVEPHPYATLDDLLLYCHRAAGVVGLMMCHVLGIADDAALPHAAHMGVAMQITNICRDVDEDRRRSRCYIPTSMLTPETAAQLLEHPTGKLSHEARRELVEPIRNLLALADRYYQSGNDGIKYLGWKSGLAIRTARLVYSSIGKRIAQQGFDAGSGRAYVSTGGKLALAAAALTKSIVSCQHSAANNDLRIPERLLQYPQSVRLDGRALVPVNQ